MVRVLHLIRVFGDHDDTQTWPAQRSRPMHMSGVIPIGLESGYWIGLPGGGSSMPHRIGSHRAAATFFSIVCIAVGSLTGCSDEHSTRADSIVSILTDPARYEGRVVTLRGYVHLGGHLDAIYLSAEDYRWDIQANGIWLHMPKCANRAGQAVGNGYMTVVGNFTTKLHGYADSWVGEIDNIKLCRLIEGADGEPRPRPIEP